ncbi:hypothetical protein RclHR1_06800014 [Rhizophagus clarus]|uniref:Uncharacterized protein n=1 Tax=Rhizophagus clarus TaxID=94130 RepID=A0A2Z6SA00_9GLOM|nr:hypothetical protein RclHR1_06800014 [Rhizophagus clarus]
MDAQTIKTIKEVTANSFRRSLIDFFQTTLPLLSQLCEGLTVTTSGAVELFNKVSQYRLDPGLSTVKPKASQQQVVASTVLATMAYWSFSILLEQLVFFTYDKIAREVDTLFESQTLRHQLEIDILTDQLTNTGTSKAHILVTLLQLSASAKRSDKSDDKIASLTTKKRKNKSSTGDNNLIITGYQPEENDKNLTLNLVVYDILAKWTNYQLLNELNKWGKVVSVSTRVQKKYQTARVRLTPNHNCLKTYNNGDWTVFLSSIPVRWFLATWSLSERKQREKFQAAITNIPEDMTIESLFPEGSSGPFINESNLQSFKIVQEQDSTRILISYFTTWEALSRRLAKNQILQPKAIGSGLNSSSFKKTGSSPVITGSNRTLLGSRKSRNNNNQENNTNSLNLAQSQKSSGRSTSSNTNKGSCKSGNRQLGNLNKVEIKHLLE